MVVAVVRKSSLYYHNRLDRVIITEYLNRPQQVDINAADYTHISVLFIHETSERPGQGEALF